MTKLIICCSQLAPLAYLCYRSVQTRRQVDHAHGRIDANDEETDVRMMVLEQANAEEHAAFRETTREVGELSTEMDAMQERLRRLEMLVGVREITQQIESEALHQQAVAQTGGGN